MSTVKDLPIKALETVQAAIAAWNSMTEQERAAALLAAGSARPVDAMRYLGWNIPADMPPVTGEKR